MKACYCVCLNPFAIVIPMSQQQADGIMDKMRLSLEILREPFVSLSV